MTGDGVVSARVRRSSHLISYWRDGSMITRNYATGNVVSGDALVTMVLTLCTEWTTRAELQRQLAPIAPNDLDRLLRSMVDADLLVREDAAADTRTLAMDTWNVWNPAAGFFHFSTKNMPVIRNRQRAEERLMEERRSSTQPPALKRYAGSVVKRLPTSRCRGAFADVLKNRRTWRSFSRKPIALADISTLLQLTWGVQRTVQSAMLGPVHLKTSPSSGARQPLEAYMLAVRVRGLAPGLYHYVPDEHCLELLKRGAGPRTVARYIPGQWWYDQAAAIFMMTAVFARTQWRYRFPRAYRSVLLEAGHVGQTFCLAATWLGLAPFCTGRFADAAVEKDLGIDGITESFIYGTGVGHRPEGIEWAPWPLDSSPQAPFMRGRRRSIHRKPPREPASE